MELERAGAACQEGRELVVGFLVSSPYLGPRWAGLVFLFPRTFLKKLSQASFQKRDPLSPRSLP